MLRLHQFNQTITRLSFNDSTRKALSPSRAKAWCMFALAASMFQSPTLAQKAPASHDEATRYIVIMKQSAALPVSKQMKASSDRAKKADDNRPARELNFQKARGLRVRHNIGENLVHQDYTDLLVGYCAELQPDQVEALRNDHEVAEVCEDAFFRFETAEFAWGTYSGTEKPAYWVDANILAAGGPYDGTNKDTFIWVLDSGIDLNHPDLNVNTHYAASMVGGTAQDDYGHGTMVAGVAAAKYNTIGATGISAGATVVPIKVGSESWLGVYGAAASAILAGLDYIAQNDMAGDVVTMSMAYDDSSCGASGLGKRIRDAVIDLGLQGTYVCGGAGNDSDCTGASDILPACVNGFRVYSVGATTIDGQCADYSNWGPTVDWATVGEAYSTYLNKKYTAASGTSFATPIVAGIIHATGKGPVSIGTVNCCSANYHKAGGTALMNARFDVELELQKFDVKNVRDLDGTEDLFGKFQFKSLKALTKSATTATTMWSNSQAQAFHVPNGAVSISKRVPIIQNLSYAELRSIELTVSGNLADEEGIFSPRKFQCNDCTTVSGDVGTRALKFLGFPSTTYSINALSNNSTFQAISFGSDKTFEINYFENGNQNDGWVKTVWKVWVKPHP